MFLYIIPIQNYIIVKERIEMHAIIVISFKIISFFFYDFIPLAGIHFVMNKL